MGDEPYQECRAQELFDEFVSASTCRAVLRTFGQLCEHLQMDTSTAERPLYRPIKCRLNYWRANALWAKLDRRAAQQEYLRARVCNNTTCVIIGAGPCGLRTAVELSFMGARVVLLEKRDSFSRNNVLHLWPFTIHDLRGLGAKKFYGKFCASSIDHISIRQLQLVLLKVALLLGVEVHVNVEFKNLVEPPDDQRRKIGWRMEVNPKCHPVNHLEFDVIVGADGRRNTLPGFRRKEFRGKLAIAITANFKNRNTSAEAKVEELSGVAFIFNQRFFQELRQETGIDLENIVYYKDDTHYFVMTAKKQSLLEKRVILQDFAHTEQLLSRGNVDHHALQVYAREAANFSTNHQLPSLDFAMNHYGQPDVAMFDFTCMYASENAGMIRQRQGHQLLVTLVGDSLLEPFWPMGTGVARGFLAALDSAWMIRSWSQGGAPLDVLAERESLYRLLPQTTPENMQKNISVFSVDPTTRYVNVNTHRITPDQVRHLLDTGEEAGLNANCGDIIHMPSPRTLREESAPQTNQLLTWCQEQTRGYRGVAVTDLTTSWKSGLAVCAVIHRCRPDLIDFDALDESLVEENTRLGFDVAEQELGISPLMTVEEMLSVGEPDSLSMVVYLSQFYQLLKDSPPPAGCLSRSSDLRSALVTPASLLSRLGHSPSRKSNPKELKDAAGKRRKTSGLSEEQQESCDGGVDGQMCDNASLCMSTGSRVRLMANQLQAKLDQTLSSSASPHRQGEVLSSVHTASECADAAAQPSSWRPRKRTLQQEQMSFRFKEKIKCQSALIRDEKFPVCCSDVCFFCQQRVYVMERLSAEGLFFHRSCFQCDFCSSSLRLSAYTFDQHAGKFYCLHHYDCRLSTTTARRPMASDTSASHRTSVASQGSGPSLPSSDSQDWAQDWAERRRSSEVSVMAATPERIELENCRRSSTEVGLCEEAELHEISEETLNQFNLNVEQKQEVSSESGSDEEDDRGGHVTSVEVSASLRETLHHLLRRNEDEEEDYDEGSEVENREEFSNLVPQSVSSVAGSDITGSETPVEPYSTLSSLTPPPGTTPSTASFITIPDSTHYEGRDTVVAMETASQQLVPRQWGSFDDISPELPLKKPLPQYETWAWSEEAEAGFDEDVETERGRRRHHLPTPLQGLLQLKGLKEAPHPGQVEVEGGGARALWRAVFSGNKKKEKKRGWSSPPVKTKVTANQRRATDMRGSLTEESNLESSALLQRCSLKPRNNLRLEVFDLTSEIHRVTITEEEEEQEPLYVPHALAFKRSYAIKRHSGRDRLPLQDSDGQSSCRTEVVGVVVELKEPSSLSVKEALFHREREGEDEDLDTKITRRVQRAARRQAKQEQQKRLHKAQMIQRRLQQVEQKQRELEEKGVMVEKALRGEADYYGDSIDCQEVNLHLGGLSRVENPVLMHQWFQLVQQKNSLLRYESELLIFARELELEDRQSRLQQELREKMAVDDHLKGAQQLLEERMMLGEMLEVAQQRDSLVSLLEEQRKQQPQEQQDQKLDLKPGPVTQLILDLGLS
ncbi:protein-methionine sulfoxide oxidase mical3b isoform X1 [Hippoglossus stenolepis]|uniref:protein-methionine sulfoxide oxidase mical3b isoform X1 n=1 Tax=Hippoglossus stenolepis TaxID=195615 RepID=UPI001FB01160|nr:protein-methionine sulfoxide oxidase mical3b isoform X1 [Hippoglossus stenolepis]